MRSRIESLRRQYPFQGHFLDLNGLRLHYLDEGRGEPIVCVHGNPTWSFYFRNLVLALRYDYRLIVPDHIGCGLSHKPGDDRYEYVLDRRIDDLEALLDRLKLTSGVTLMLHDWGGMIGMGVAVRRPERIKRLIILNTAAFRLPEGKRLPVRLRLIRSGGPLAALLVRSFNAFARGAAHMAVCKPLSHEIRAGYLTPYDSWGNRIATLRFVQDIPLDPSDRSYATVLHVEQNLHRFRDLPMLICWGERDFVFDADFLSRWQLHFPHAEVHSFPDAGHYVLEDAGHAVNSVIRDFMLMRN